MKKKIVLRWLVLTQLWSPVLLQACPGTPGSVERIICLADSLKATLTASQIATLQLTYTYDNARTWSNLPVSMQPRLGLSLGSLTTTQRAIAKTLIAEVTRGDDTEGYQEIEELLLADDYLQANGGGSGYGSGLYYLCFNGTPATGSLFSIKVGGHHLQVENTYNQDVMVGGTPHFEAVEPLTFTTSGVTYRPLGQERDALAAMLAGLSSTELSTARLTATFSDILMGAKNNGSYKDWIFPATKVGLQVGTLTQAQQDLVMAAIRTYVLDIDTLNANAILRQYEEELADTYIAYSGTTGLATRNDYVRIDGPGVWIEFSIQNGVVFSGVHYHSIWRDHLRDYGGAGSTAGVQTTAVGVSATTAISDPLTASPLSVGLVYPNPVLDIAQIPFELSQQGWVQMVVYDRMGRQVTALIEGQYFTAGTHEVPFDQTTLQLPGGVYWVEMQVRSGAELVRKTRSFLIK